MNLLLVMALCAMPLSSSFAASVDYTQRVGYYTTWTDGGGTFDNGTTEIGQWAHNAAKQTVAWRTLKTAGDNTGSARHLAVGDEFTITVYASSAYGGLGVSLNSAGWGTGSWANRYSNSRVYLEVDGIAGQWYVNSSAGNAAFGASVSSTSKDYQLKLKITSENTVTVREISDATTYTKFDCTMNGTAGTNISGYSVFLSDDWNGSATADIYWKPTTRVENTLAVEFGGDSGTRTIAGRITDGLVANSTSIASVNSLYKIGTGTITLSDPNNSYTGKTQIEAGTLCISNDTNLGTAPATVTKAHIKFFNNASLRALETMTLSANRGIESPDLNETFFIGVAAGKTLTYAGSISGGTATTYCVKNYPGTLQLTGTNAFPGQLVIDTGTLELNSASGVVLSNEFIRLGADTGSDNVVLTLNSSSGLEVRKGLVVRATGGSKTINNAAGNNLVSQSVFLDGNVTSVVTAGSLTYSGAEFDLKSQTLAVSGAGNTIISSTVKGSGQVVKNGAGKLILSGANIYSGTTVINAGTLSGTGSVSASAVTLNTGARVAPGMSVGNLRTGALTMNAGTSYDWEFSNTTSDWIGAQALTLPSGAGTANSVTIAVSRTDAVTYPVTRPLFTYSSFTPAQTNALYFDLTAVAADTLQPPTLAFNGNSVLISLVPEPAALALLAMLICGLRLKGFGF